VPQRIEPADPRTPPGRRPCAGHDSGLRRRSLSKMLLTAGIACKTNAKHTAASPTPGRSAGHAVSCGRATRCGHVWRQSGCRRSSASCAEARAVCQNARSAAATSCGADARFRECG
jgi:hypothetical protein